MTRTRIVVILIVTNGTETGIGQIGTEGVPANVGNATRTNTVIEIGGIRRIVETGIVNVTEAAVVSIVVRTTPVTMSVVKNGDAKKKAMKELLMASVEKKAATGVRRGIAPRILIKGDATGYPTRDEGPRAALMGPLGGYLLRPLLV